MFANSMEVSSKSMSGKSICEFPDVCFTPPQTPATPAGVPIPYPNTGMASDTTDGSRTVNVGGQEVMLKDKSSFKKSSGDEAGSAPKKGLLSSTNKGAVYFVAGSMDVKVEGESVVRNLDLTTHNHASRPATGSLPAPHNAKTAKGSSKRKRDPCKHRNNKKRRTYVVYESPDAEHAGKTYVGRTNGPQSMSVRDILAKRRGTHHRKLAKILKPVCVTTSYAACRGAEQKHLEAKGKAGAPGKPGPKGSRRTAQINGISPKNKRRTDYLACAKKLNKNCPICSA